jgi:hypothetical protein
MLRKPRKDLLSYDEAKELVKNKFPRGSSKTLYRAWTREPDFPSDKLPLYPPDYYRIREGWKGWGDFSRNGQMSTTIVDYADAKELARKKFPGGFTDYEFRKWDKSGDDFPIGLLPKDPSSYYKARGTWLGWGDFGRTENICRNDSYLNYDDAKALIQEIWQGGSMKQYRLWIRKSSFPHDLLPKDPPTYYIPRGTWIGWGDFCGTGNTSNKEYLSYEEARNIVIEKFQNRGTKETYREWYYTDDFPKTKLPPSPDSYYMANDRGWKAWPHFMGRERTDYGYVYAIGHPNWPNYIKIGKESRSGTRATTANVFDPTKSYYYIKQVRFSDSRTAEKTLHMVFEDKRISGEWFNITKEEVSTALDYLKENEPTL